MRLYKDWSSGNPNLLHHRSFEGYCENIPQGAVRVELWVGFVSQWPYLGCGGGGGGGWWVVVGGSGGHGGSGGSGGGGRWWWYFWWQVVVVGGDGDGGGGGSFDCGWW